MTSHAAWYAACCALVCSWTSAPAGAQNYPNKPIRVVVPIGAGGSTDMVGRIMSQRFAEQMGVSSYVDNRPGGGAVIGTDLVAKSPPDGYTVLAIATEFTINPNLRKLPYDPIKDFTCVVQVTSSQYFLSTHPVMPVKTVQQFIALAKSRPGQVTFGSSGPGSANHLAGVLFQTMTGAKLVHVPYKSAGQAGIALMSGEIDVMFSNVASAIAQVRAGRLRAIATTGPKRSPVAPNVPTMSESGLKEFIVTGFHLLFVPGATPPEIVARLNEESVKALETTALKERLASLGLEPMGGTPADCTKLVKADLERWGPVVKAGGARAD